MANKDFYKALGNAEEAYEEGRKGRSGGYVNIPDGSYVVRMESVELGADGKIPFVHFKMVVVHSEHGESEIGEMIQQRVKIEERSGTNDKGDWKITKADQFADICNIFQKFGEDTEESELSDLVDMADKLTEEDPACRVQVKTRKTSGWRDIKYQKFIADDGDFPGIDDVLEDDDEPLEDDDESLEDDDQDDAEDQVDDDDDDEEEDEFEPPTKGDVVMALLKGAKRPSACLVNSVNKSKETCTLTRKRDNKKEQNVPWDRIKA